MHNVKSKLSRLAAQILHVMNSMLGHIIDFKVPFTNSVPLFCKWGGTDVSEDEIIMREGSCHQGFRDHTRRERAVVDTRLRRNSCPVLQEATLTYQPPILVLEP